MSNNRIEKKEINNLTSKTQNEWTDIIKKAKSKDEIQSYIQWDLDTEQPNEYAVTITDLGQDYGIEIKNGLFKDSSIYRVKISKTGEIDE